MPKVLLEEIHIIIIVIDSISEKKELFIPKILTLENFF